MTSGNSLSLLEAGLHFPGCKVGAITSPRLVDYEDKKPDHTLSFLSAGLCLWAVAGSVSPGQEKGAGAVDPGGQSLLWAPLAPRSRPPAPAAKRTAFANKPFISCIRDGAGNVTEILTRQEKTARTLSLIVSQGQASRWLLPDNQRHQR